MILYAMQAPAHATPHALALQGLLGGNYQVKNFGNSGKTMLKYGQPGDSAYWNQTTWPAAQAFDADVYTILLGT